MRRSLLAVAVLLSGWRVALGADATAPGHPPAVLFVYDASGSMKRPVEGRAKDEIARAVMTEVLGELAPGIRVGLLAFGHRRKGDCSDLEVVAPVGSERAAIADTVRAIRPKGETPLAEAVRLAVAQLASYEGPASIVVVSDGKDECGGDPCAAAREAIASGVHVRMHVVGFDVGREQAEQLQCIAREGHGKYFAASNARQLGKALEEIEREVAPAPTPAGPTAAECLPPKRGSIAPIACECSAEAVGRGSVWGTDLYTDDSSVCRAAVHAGVIPKTGGTLTAYPYGGQDAYAGSERNGIYSSDYGAFEGSFGFREGLVPQTGGCPPRLTAKDLAQKEVSCECSAKAAGDGHVWGTDVYTADSSLCRAAVHAGVIEPGGGRITAYPLPGRGSYDGEERNGVRSQDYGKYDRSFAFKADVPATLDRCIPELVAEGKPLACRCRAADTRSGGIWGTDVYTGDSAICVAAVHAGAIPASGGTVTVVGAPGREAYEGGERNGVRSGAYGRYDRSFRFETK